MTYRDHIIKFYKDFSAAVAVRRICLFDPDLSECGCALSHTLACLSYVLAPHKKELTLLTYLISQQNMYNSFNNGDDW